MYRYLSLIWDVTNPLAAATALDLAQRFQKQMPGWQRVFKGGGCEAYHAGVRKNSSVTYSVARDSGVVFGKLFSCDPYGEPHVSAEHSLPPDLRENILQDYWGRYVALFHDRATHTTRFLRDPTGSLPCLIAQYQQVVLVFSDIADCLKLGLTDFTVNWSYIAAASHRVPAAPGLTGLREVSELQPGEVIMIRNGRQSRQFAWSMEDIAQRDPITDPEIAAISLRRAVKTSVHAWASTYDGVLHMLSGGLDSSIVLSCIADAPKAPALSCLNYFGLGRNEDERHLARLAAEKYSAKLIEHQLRPDTVDLELLYKLHPSALPSSYQHEIEHGTFEAALAEQHGASAIFSGAGGDAIFYGVRTELSVADYLVDQGLRPSLFSVAADAAYATGFSLWKLLWKAVQLRYAPRSAPLSGHARVPSLLLDTARMRGLNRELDVTRPRRAEQRLPPGKQWHVESLRAQPFFYDALGRDDLPERTFPLLSQPLIEVCLRIPTYTLTHGGIDRALARIAFNQDLPSEIITRYDKGNIEQHVRAVMDRWLNFAREFLLDGCLVKEGLLDRARLEEYLSGQRQPDDSEYNEILHTHLGTEAWLRRWIAC